MDSLQVEHTDRSPSQDGVTEDGYLAVSSHQQPPLIH